MECDTASRWHQEVLHYLRRQNAHQGKQAHLMWGRAHDPDHFATVHSAHPRLCCTLRDSHPCMLKHAILIDGRPYTVYVTGGRHAYLTYYTERSLTYVNRRQQSHCPAVS